MFPDLEQTHVYTERITLKCKTCCFAYSWGYAQPCWHDVTHWTRPEFPKQEFSNAGTLRSYVGSWGIIRAQRACGNTPGLFTFGHQILSSHALQLWIKSSCGFSPDTHVAMTPLFNPKPKPLPLIHVGVAERLQTKSRLLNTSSAWWLCWCQARYWYCSRGSASD